MDQFKNIEQRIIKIERRNKRVEADKAWEISFVRRFFIALFTYLAIGFYLNAILVSRPWLNAIIPTIGFLLSTLTLPFIRRVWEKYKKQD